MPALRLLQRAIGACALGQKPAASLWDRAFWPARATFEGIWLACLLVQLV